MQCSHTERAGGSSTHTAMWAASTCNSCSRRDAPWRTAVMATSVMATSAVGIACHASVHSGWREVLQRERHATASRFVHGADRDNSNDSALYRRTAGTSCHTSSQKSKSLGLPDVCYDFLLHVCDLILYISRHPGRRPRRPISEHDLQGRSMCTAR